MQTALTDPHRVLDAFRQRRNLNQYYPEAEIQIFTETAIDNGILNILVRCGDDTDINRQCAVTADSGYQTIFQYAQQFDLHIETHVADFIEKKCALVSIFEMAGAAVLRARERAFFVAEEGRLGEGAGDAAAVDHDEWLVLAGAGRVDG